MSNTSRVFAVLLALTLPIAVFAQGPLIFPNEEHWVFARFTSNPTAVTVDVLEMGGALVADDVAAAQQTMDAEETDIWALDLAALPGWPVNCESKTYLVQFNPDATDCTDDGDPGSCSEQQVKIGGPRCKFNPSLQVAYAYSTVAVAAQGISTSVTKYHERRGTEAVKWRKVIVANDGDFTTPDHTYWDVYFWGVSGIFPTFCTVYTESDPAVSLPTSC